MKVKAMGFLVVVMVMVSSAEANIYSLFSDQRAVRVDDILTVMIVESAKAGSESQTNANKESQFGLEGSAGSGALGFIPALGASGGNSSKYDGKGGTSRKGNLVATVSARIIDVLDNGNLIIEGSKTVEINQETEIIKISGIVRPRDIQKDNVIYSSSIADAQITYSGKGVVNTTQRPGLLTRFIKWIF